MPTETHNIIALNEYQLKNASGRKLVQTNDGTFYAALNAEDNYLKIYKSEDNGTSWEKISENYYSHDVALVAKGNDLHIIHSGNVRGNAVYYRKYSEGVFHPSVQLGLYASIKGLSITVNEAGTELHAVWVAKPATMVNFNLIYNTAKIDDEGNVSWEQSKFISEHNNSSYGADAGYVSAEIFMYKDEFRIAATQHLSGLAVHLISKTSFTSNYSSQLIDGWYMSYVQGHTSRTALSDYLTEGVSAIYIPQSVSGLTNGRIWLAWSGNKTTNGTENAIYTAYSDDGGSKWTKFDALVSTAGVSYINAAITANKYGEVMLSFTRTSGTLYRKSFLNGAWKSNYSITSGITSISLFHDSEYKTAFSKPIMMYLDTRTDLAAFYGEWLSTRISVKEGNLGDIKSKNLLSYAVTSDGAMSPIIERVNGVAVGVKQASSGEQLSVSLTEEQWQQIPYGKYADGYGTINTLTIEVDDRKWTYPFVKLVNDNSSLLETVKAVNDSNEAYLPSIRRKLAAKLSASSSSSFDELLKLAEDTGFQWATGTNNHYIYNREIYPEAIGLDFKPKFIVVVIPESEYPDERIQVYDGFFNLGHSTISAEDISITSSGFTFIAPVETNDDIDTNYTYTNWLAIG